LVKTVEHGHRAVSGCFFVAGKWEWRGEHRSTGLTSKTSFWCKNMSANAVAGWKKTMKKWNYSLGFDKF